MCGRAKLETDYSETKIPLDFWDRAPAPNLRPSWNIAPTQNVLTAVFDKEVGHRVPWLCHWGLIPSWSKEPKMKFPTFNARAETVSTAASFRGAWNAGRRCLLVFDGFYEWARGVSDESPVDSRQPRAGANAPRSDKQPFLITRADGNLMVMGGLYEIWKSPTGETIRSATIITLPANSFLARLHDRMPLILARDLWPLWLGETGLKPADAVALIKPCAPKDLIAVPVDKKIGNVRNNDPSVARPIGPPLPE